jgi:uncharacterized protein
MEYEFIHDPTNGAASATFSLEHENLGPWLEIELANSTDKLTQLLNAITDIESGKKDEIIIVGHEFSITFDKEDVTVKSNAASGNGLANDDFSAIFDELPASEQYAMSSCGLDDFRQLLLSWSQFVN